MDDLELVKDILNGNKNSFNAIVNKYELMIFRFVFNMTKDAEASKDITQETFITVYNKLYTYKGKGKLPNWIYQIAQNKCYDYLRKNKKNINLNIEAAWNIESNEIPPEQWMELKESRKELSAFIKSLDKVDKQILILRSLRDNLTFDDISDLLKLSAPAIKARYYRLLNKYNCFKE